MKSKKLALCALLTALGLTLSYAENFLPLTLFVPIPGLKLGLSNTVTLAALYLLGGSYAATISFARCFLGAFDASGLTSLWFSLCGAVMSLIIMWMLKTYASRITSLWGVSIAGSAAHNFGQICAAAAVMRTWTIFAYLPVLLIASIGTGFIIAAVSQPILILIRRWKQ